MNKKKVLTVKKKLEKLDFTNIDRKFKEEYPRINTKRIKEEFIRYFSIASIQNVAPPKIIDDYWHYYILHTKKYRKECSKVFGEFIEHTPNNGSKKQRTADNEVFWETLQTYVTIFGEPDLHLWGIQKRMTGKQVVTDCDSNCCSYP